MSLVSMFAVQMSRRAVPAHVYRAGGAVVPSVVGIQVVGTMVGGYQGGCTSTVPSPS